MFNPNKYSILVVLKTLDQLTLIDCQKERCRQRYIGVTKRSFRKRVKEHIGYVKNEKISEATGEHFNLPGLSHTDMKFTIIEQVKSLDPISAREREIFCNGRVVEVVFVSI